MTNTMRPILQLAAVTASLLLAACGGGDDASLPQATDTGGSAFQPTTASLPPSTPVYCDGVMLAGSTRWCKQDDGTVKDMSTNTVWLRDAGCSGSNSFYASFAWPATVASGSCALTDGSKAGGWDIPGAPELLTLTQGTEPVSYQAPGAFTRFSDGNDYWTTTLTSDGWHMGVSFNTKAPQYGNEASRAGLASVNDSGYVLPYRKSADNRATTIESGKSYALAAGTALVQVPGTSNLFTRRFVNQIQWQFCCSNAAYVVLWTWDDDSYYRTFRLWTFDSTGDGYYRIRTQGRYLAVRDASRNSGAQVIAWPYPSSWDTNDRWQPVRNGDNSWYFVNKQSGMCLQWQSNRNEESLVQQSCAPGSPNQSFIAFPRS